MDPDGLKRPLFSPTHERGGAGPVYLLLPLSFPHSIPALLLAAQRINPLIALSCQLTLARIPRHFPPFPQFFTFFSHLHFTLFHQQAMTDYEVIDVQHIYHLLITQLTITIMGTVDILSDKMSYTNLVQLLKFHTVFHPIT